ncbi:PP2C family protein-serine/threonine phosphatase [Plantactinospora sp. CA-290183]|uniref:PP2C family protein-serine/threonine phosphatase n=1 Tax=Plantactinospora sp. CA-290183 TaxID=3240006 RepID=UPI003D91B7A0
MEVDGRRWRDAVVELLERSRLAQADELAPTVNAVLADLRVRVTIYLIDHEQRALRPVPEPGHAPEEPLPVDATLAGRVFMAGEPRSAGPTGRERAPLWMPLLDGSDRLGVLRIEVPDEIVGSDRFRRRADVLAALLGHLVAVKAHYGDTIARSRRTGPMSVASELLWRLLPPLTFATGRFAVSAVFEPCYSAGGDGFDYAVDGDHAFAAICDSTGHGLRAGLGTAVVLSALRSARIDGADLPAMGRAVDTALTDEFTDARFATAVLLDLNLADGRLRYLNAGHPAPAVLRGGRAVGRLDGGRRLPLGLPDPRTRLAETRLERGDRLLCFTDGITEARGRDGTPFGEDRLIDLAERFGTAGLSAPEALRRLAHAIADHLAGPPTDDATVLLIEWSSVQAGRILP